MWMMDRLSILMGRFMMFWLQTIRKIYVDLKLKIRISIIDDEIEEALAGVPGPEADDLIKLGVEVVPLGLAEGRGHLHCDYV